MDKKNSIIRVEIEGVEYYTARSGESGMSLSGLARCCGVTRQAISKHLNVKQKDWKLDVGRVSVATKRGDSFVVVVKDTICAETILDYAKEGRQEAIQSVLGFAAIGIRTFIQKMTGYEPPSEVETFIDKHILREPRAWEVCFDRPWIKAAEQATGWKWGNPCMAQLINTTVYDRLPVEVRQRLDELNPVLENGHRAKKQHQFFSDESVEQVLKMQLEIGRSLLLVSTSWNEVKENARRRFEGMAQLRLLG